MTILCNLAVNNGFLYFLFSAGFGKFGLDFQMYTNVAYDKVHTVYPVSVMLRDWLYFQVKLSSPDKDLVLLIEKCYATPTLKRNDPNKYMFIDKR